MKLKKKPFALIGVNVMNHAPNALKKVIVKEKINWRSFAEGRDIAKRWNSPATPAFYIIDPKGTIRRKWIGHPGEKTIDAALKNLIEAAEKTGKNRSK